MRTNRKSPHWCDIAQGTGLTNFSVDQFELYEEAVRRFGSELFEVSAQPMIGRGEHSIAGSLHYLGDIRTASGQMEVSSFWKVFRDIQNEQKAAA